MTKTPPTPIVCPRCGGTVGPDQAWCLTCGAPARTRMRPTPNWKIPLAAIAAIVLIVAGGTVGAFVALTTDREAPTATTTQPAATAPAATPPAATPTETPTIPPAVGTTPAPGTTETAPGGATTTPGATTTTPGATSTPGAAATTPPPAADATPSGGAKADPTT